MGARSEPRGRQALARSRARCFLSVGRGLRRGSGCDSAPRRGAIARRRGADARRDRFAGRRRTGASSQPAGPSDELDRRARLGEGVRERRSALPRKIFDIYRRAAAGSGAICRGGRPDATRVTRAPAKENHRTARARAQHAEPGTRSRRHGSYRTKRYGAIRTLSSRRNCGRGRACANSIDEPRQAKPCAHAPSGLPCRSSRKRVARSRRPKRFAVKVAAIARR